MAFTDHTWAVGETLSAANMNGLRDNFRLTDHVLVAKSADQSVTSSIVLVNDTDLFVPLGATETWYVSFELLVFGGTGNIRFNVTVPASAVYSLSLIGLNNAGTSVDHQRLYNTGGASGDILVFTASQGYHHVLKGLVWTSGTSGNLQLQWAQGASNATPTTVKKGSLALGVKVA